MDRLIYLAMAGAKATMQRQETLANNLANASTTGFRAELAAFRAVPVEGSGASTRVYALDSTIGYDATPGQIAATGRNLDVAMRGGACTEKPFGTAASGSLNSTRTTSVPACCVLVIDWMAFCAHATHGARTP